MKINKGTTSTPNLADAFAVAAKEWDRQRDGMRTETRCWTVITTLTTNPEQWDCDITSPAHLRQVAESLSKHLGPASVNRHIAAFRGMYRINCLTPPAYRAHKEPAGRIHKPSEDQIQAMIRQLENRNPSGILNPSPEASVVLILKETGMRAGELFKLTQDDVDVEGDWITIPEDKAGTGRRIPVSHYMAMLVHELVPLEVSYSTFSTKWRSARDTLGLPSWFVPHSLRHYRASVLAETGTSVPVVAALLGHKSWKTTMRYTHIDLSAMRSAVNATSGAGGTGLPATKETYHKKSVLRDGV